MAQKKTQRERILRAMAPTRKKNTGYPIRKIAQASKVKEKSAYWHVGMLVKEGLASKMPRPDREGQARYRLLKAPSKIDVRAPRGGQS